MNRSVGLCATAATLVLVAVAPLAAHDFWIEPSTFHPQPGALVSIGLRVGQGFVGDAVRRSSDLIEQFTVRQAGRNEPVGGSEGTDPAGFLVARGGETTVVVYSGTPSYIEMPAGKFEDYLRLEGLERIVELRKARGKSSKPGHEYFTRYAKSLLTGQHESAAVTRPVGLELEVVPDSDPTAHAGPLRGHLLYQGRPLGGVLVVAMPQPRPAARLTTRTDDHGAFMLPLPHGGVWLIKAVHMVEAGWFSRADWQSLWASLTFDAPNASAKPQVAGS